MGIKKSVLSAIFLAVALVGVSTGAFALEAADITAVTGASGAEESISAGWKWVLGVVIVLFAGRKVIGMFGK